MDMQMDLNGVSKDIINAALKVHSALGPGLLESAYETCLKHELASNNLMVQTQVELPVYYDGVTIDVGYRLDMLINNSVIVELKSVDKLLPIHEAQLLSYLKLGNKKLGLLINFNVPRLKYGIKRIVNNF